MREVTPKSLILDILRVSSGAVPVKGLVSIGALFGLEGNAIRVALTRLGKRGLVLRTVDGYRLAPGANVLSRWVDEWRLGDKRLRAWKGDWLSIHVPRGSGRTDRERSRRALLRYGLREGLEGLWVRPDNLRQPRAHTLTGLRELGLCGEVSAFTGRDFAPELLSRWSRTLWDIASLEAASREALTAVTRSAEHLAALTTEEGLVESFMVGGHGIRVLATDPGLPDGISDGRLRRSLHAAVVDYDRLGKRLWRRMLGPGALEAAPGHLVDIGVAHVR